MTQVWERLHIGSISDAESLAVSNPAQQRKENLR